VSWCLKISFTRTLCLCGYYTRLFVYENKDDDDDDDDDDDFEHFLQSKI